MKKTTLLLLLSLLAILGRAETQKYQVHYTVNISGKYDSTALYQRVETKNEAEPYTLGDIVCYLHNGSGMIAEREYGLYEKGKEFYATVTIDGKKYFISARTISGNDSSGVDWVYEGLPDEEKDKSFSWVKILLFVGGGLLLLGIVSGGSRSSSGTSSGETSYQSQEKRRKDLAEQAKKSREESEKWHAKWREQLKKEGKW